MWIRELATGWERVYKPSEHASASVTRGTRDAVPTVIVGLELLLYLAEACFSTNCRSQVNIYSLIYNYKLIKYKFIFRYSLVYIKNLVPYTIV
jgi:hypothetical protein